MTTTTTAAPIATCCYEGCDRPAADHDCDGDLACQLHADQSEEYVELFDSFDAAGDWMQASEIPGTVERLAEMGWTVSIRETRSGEAAGTYRRNRDGSLQILGYSLEKPEGLSEDFDTAVEAAREALAASAS